MRKTSSVNWVVAILALVSVAAIAVGGLFAAEETKPKAEKNFFMFVQAAQSGEFKPIEGKKDTYLLTLNNVNPATTYFSDRPQRIVGNADMVKFLKGLGFSEKNPPNAAIQLLNGDKDQETIVVELYNPKYDATKKTLQYELKILEEGKKGLAVFNEAKDKTLPAHFGDVSLFIDDCQNTPVYCCLNYAVQGVLQDQDMCWDWKWFVCGPCYGWDYEAARCNGSFTGCKGSCEGYDDTGCFHQ